MSSGDLSIGWVGTATAVCGDEVLAFGHQTDSEPGEVIPLFPLVYSDCVQIMNHQGTRIGTGDEKKVADHILFAEMCLPRFGTHLYWKGDLDEKRAHALREVGLEFDRRYAIDGDDTRHVPLQHLAADTRHWRPGTHTLPYSKGRRLGYHVYF